MIGGVIDRALSPYLKKYWPTSFVWGRQKKSASVNMQWVMSEHIELHKENITLYKQWEHLFLLTSKNRFTFVL